MKTIHLAITCIALAASTPTVLHAQASAAPPDKTRAAKIIFPKIDFRDSSVRAAIDFLVAKSQTLAPEGSIVPILFAEPEAAKSTKVTFTIDNVSLAEAVKYLALAAGLEMARDGEAIILKTPVPGLPAKGNGLATGAAAYPAKATKIIFPKIDFRDSTASEALEFLSFRSRSLDSEGLGVPILLFAPKEKDANKVTLSVSNVPLSEAVKYVAMSAGLEVAGDGRAIIVRTPTPGVAAKGDGLATGAAAYPAKATKIILPKIDFLDSTVLAALEFLSARSRSLDPEGLGVPILLFAPKEKEAKKVTLTLSNVPLSEAVRYVAKIADMEVAGDGRAIIVRTPVPRNIPPAVPQLQSPQQRMAAVPLAVPPAVAQAQGAPRVAPAPGGAPAAANQLEEALTSFVWSWHHKGTRFKTTLRFEKDGSVNTAAGGQLWRWSKTGPRSAKILYNPGKRWDLEVLFDESFSSFDGLTGAENTVLGARLSPRESQRNPTQVAQVLGAGQPKANPAVPANAPVPAPGNPANPQADPKAIALHPTWMPDRHAMGEKAMKAMAFYARAALDGAEPGKEIVPTKVLSGAGWDLDWLMPLRDAEKKLPPGVTMQMAGAAFLQNGTWPQKSIYVRSATGTFLMPGHETELPPRPSAYLEVVLICDQKERLIGVECRADDRQGPGWNSLTGDNPPPQKGQPTTTPPRTRGGNPMIGGIPMIGGNPMMGGALNVQTLNPYVDLMTLNANAAAGRDVQYQIVRNRDNPAVVVPGMTCIHTYVAGGGIGTFRKNVRLYLAAPFARKLVDIAEMYEKGTAPAR